MLAVKKPEVSASQSSMSMWLLILLVVQLVLGAFTAGLDAGYGFNTWPLMHGQFLADAALMMSPFWLNFVENGVMIQFIHRWLGALLLLGILWFAFKSRGTALFGATMILVGVTLVQFLLGVTTLLYRVPVVLGSLHQAVACLMLLALVYCVYLSRRPREAQ